ncbi:MAG: hypothetical protein E4H13_09115 [Calditrichales bacterium]|nr:MAG: hypothetical protein E4H13_09115 [Calditrichales bacterium]
MEAGRFYSTTGVTLSRIRFNGKTISIGIDAAPGVTYTTQFIGTVKDFPAEVQKLNSEDGDYVQYIYSDAIGKELARSDNLNPEYTLKGDELYVRVRITSSKSKDNPNYSDEKETAWTQPFRYSSAE